MSPSEVVKQNTYDNGGLVKTAKVEKSPVVPTSMPAKDTPSCQKSKSVKRRIPEKTRIFASNKFDDFSVFDVFDFIQYRTQVKIVQAKAALSGSLKRAGHFSLERPKKRKRFPSAKLSDSVRTSIKSETSSQPTEISQETLKAFFLQFPEIKSTKKARGMIKSKKLIAEFLKRHPNIPVEKSHKPRGVSQPFSPTLNRRLTSSPNLSTVRLIEKVVSRDVKSPSVPNSAPVVEEMNPLPARSSNGNATVEQAKLTNSFSTELSSQAQVLNGNSPGQNQVIDHAAAINNWIKQNYHNLSTAEKQLVHLQLHYINNLKKEAFRNSAFVLSPQHVNNLNNLAFLSAHYNNFNRTYSYVNLPTYNVEAGQVNMQLLQALKGQPNNSESREQSFTVRMPVQPSTGPVKEVSEPNSTEDSPSKIK